MITLPEVETQETEILNVTMLPKQIQFMQADKKEVLFSGAFRASKTRALCYKTLQHALIPNNFVGLCRKEYMALKNTTLRTLLKPDGDLPPVLPEGYYTHHKADHTISIHGGGEIYYFGFDKPSRMGSLGMGAIGIDEGTELDEDEYMMLMGRISNKTDPCRQVFTATNPGPPSHFLHKRFFKDNDSTRTVINTNSYENFFLPQDYLDWLDSLEGADHDRYALGKWVGYEGLVYKIWNRPTHFVHRDGPWQRVVMGFDEGFVHPGTIVVVGGCTFEYGKGPITNVDIRRASRTGPGYHDEPWETGRDYPPVLVRWSTRTNLELCMRLIAEGKLNVDALTTHTIRLADAGTGVAAILDEAEEILGVLFEN